MDSLPESVKPFIERIDENRVMIKPGFVPGMKVPGILYANETLFKQMVGEYLTYYDAITHHKNPGLTPSIVQIANVACMDGIIGQSMAMPDAHSGYGFSIGGVAAVDVDDPNACVYPGGVGYDINCGIFLMRTNIKASDLTPELKTKLADMVYSKIPVGVGQKSSFKADDVVLKKGLNWLVEQHIAWPEDLDCCEDNGCMLDADPSCVPDRAKLQGQWQLGTLGSGNHFIEIQVVDEIFDETAAKVMGFEKGTICVMVHTGSRGLGYKTCDDTLKSLLSYTKKYKIYTKEQMREQAREQAKKMYYKTDDVPTSNTQTCNTTTKKTDFVVNKSFMSHPRDDQLCGILIKSPEGQAYIKGMMAAANYAYANRGLIRQWIREAFVEVFKGVKPTGENLAEIEKLAREMDMHLVYEVCHNIAKFEEHTLETSEGPKKVNCLVHRKGATRAFPPGHPLVPEKYRAIGQPIIVGGSMGTCSFMLTGAEGSMKNTFGSTCHGAGRTLGRKQAMKTLFSDEVQKKLKDMGIILKIGTPEETAEEAPEAYKDVSEVVKVCHDAGISKYCVRMRPLIVIKG